MLLALGKTGSLISPRALKRNFTAIPPCDKKRRLKLMGFPTEDLMANDCMARLRFGVILRDAIELIASSPFSYQKVRPGRVP
jgi:hypothetical protein